jgi:alpha-L-arabinofuranosidase
VERSMREGTKRQRGPLSLRRARALPISSRADAVATKSADGRTLCFKAVNPLREKVAVDLALKTGFTASEAKIKLVAPGSLQARNTLEEPHAVRPIPGRISIDEGRVRFKLPGLSAGVVTIKLR